jgi:hypothetical protein
MHADGDARLGPEYNETVRLRRLLRVPAFEDRAHPFDTGGLRALDDCLEVIRELVAGEMTMAIDHERFIGFRGFMGVQEVHGFRRFIRRTP